ncbi:response regulator [bacterium]|nr:response regulator [bacterium]
MNAQKIKILIAEDDKSSRNLLARILYISGFNQVEEAENGMDAWDKLQQSPFDLLITDWMMPEMDGYQLLSTIRKSALEVRNIPVIIISSLHDVEDIKKVASLGVSGYLIKPFNTKIILQKISAIFP